MARSADQLRGRLKSADALVVFHEVSITREIIGELDNCRGIVRCGVGYDNIDVAAASEKNIVVCNTPDYGVDEVADHAIGLMLVCTRRLLVADRRLRSSPELTPWDRQAVAPVPRLAESTLGIIGCGRIGMATALRAKALKMRVLINDPYLRPGIDKALGVTSVDFQALLAQSDVVSLHTPLTEETRHLINTQTLAAMKPTAVLINTARGAVVDLTALANALREGRLAGAGIDVLPEEPPQPNNPLIQLWQEHRDPPVNLVLTPHTAYYSEAALREMRHKAAEEIARILRGQPPLNPVNSPCPPRFP